MQNTASLTTKGCTVITYSSPTGCKISLTPAQCARLTKAGTWPKDHTGQEYCSVSFGRHYGSPSCSDSELGI